MITMNVNDVLSALALSPRGPWQALHPDLAGLYVFGSCATRWAGARGFGLSKPSKSVLFQAFWDFASSLAEYSSDNSSIGKAKQRINEASKGSTKHPASRVFLRLSSVRCRVAAGLDFRPWWFWPAWRSSAGPFRCFLHWFQHHLGTHQQSSHLHKPVPRAGGECVCYAGNIARTCKHWWHAADAGDLRFVRERATPICWTLLVDGRCRFILVFVPSTNRVGFSMPCVKLKFPLHWADMPKR